MDKIEIQKIIFFINFSVETEGKTYQECYEKAIVSSKNFIDNYFKHNYLRQF
jgi:hypothetical protein